MYKLKRMFEVIKVMIIFSRLLMVVINVSMQYKGRWAWFPRDFGDGNNGGCHETQVTAR